jgi:hypothetical protein
LLCVGVFTAKPEESFEKDVRNKLTGGRRGETRRYEIVVRVISSTVVLHSLEARLLDVDGMSVPRTLSIDRAESSFAAWRTW